MEQWRAYFERNRAERLPVPWHEWEGEEPKVTDAQRGPLIRSLIRFQIGESGEGLHLKAGAAKTGNADYQAAIALFIAEEQEHSRWLAGLLEGLGGTLLTFHWSNRVFVWLRRLCGLRVEIMVLLVAEMIAVRYYRALHEGTQNDPVLSHIFAQIRGDETGHVAFHCDVLRGVFAHRSFYIRFAVRWVWQMIFALACLLVMVDHRSVLRAMGVSPLRFWRDAHRVFDDTAQSIFDPALALLPRLVRV